MKLNQIRDVIAIADRGSLRAAALHLGLAQPALTRSIRELEHELGVDLFERQARGMALTPFGEAFIRRARSVQSELERARDELDQMRGLTTGSVSIGVSMAASISFLPVLPAFGKQFPNVRVNVTEGAFPQVRARLAEGDMDFYIGPILDQPVPREFALEELLEGERVVLARKGHPLAGAQSIAELADAGWVSTSISVTNHGEHDPIFKPLGLPPPRIAVETNSALSTFMTVTHSDLLVILPRQYLRHPGAEHSLEQIKIKEKLYAPAICCIRRARLPLTPAAQFLLDLIERAAGIERRQREQREKTPAH